MVKYFVDNNIKTAIDAIPKETYIDGILKETYNEILYEFYEGKYWITSYGETFLSINHPGIYSNLLTELSNPHSGLTLKQQTLDGKEFGFTVENKTVISKYILERSGDAIILFDNKSMTIVTQGTFLTSKIETKFSNDLNQYNKEEFIIENGIVNNDYLKFAFNFSKLLQNFTPSFIQKFTNVTKIHISNQSLQTEQAMIILKNLPNKEIVKEINLSRNNIENFATTPLNVTLPNENYYVYELNYVSISSNPPLSFTINVLEENVQNYIKAKVKIAENQYNLINEDNHHIEIIRITTEVKERTVPAGVSKVNSGVNDTINEVSLRFIISKKITSLSFTIPNHNIKDNTKILTLTRNHEDININDEGIAAMYIKSTNFTILSINTQIVKHILDDYTTLERFDISRNALNFKWENYGGSKYVINSELNLEIQQGSKRIWNTIKEFDVSFNEELSGFLVTTQWPNLIPSKFNMEETGTNVEAENRDNDMAVDMGATKFFHYNKLYTLKSIILDFLINTYIKKKIIINNPFLSSENFTGTPEQLLNSLLNNFNEPNQGFQNDEYTYFRKDGVNYIDSYDLTEQRIYEGAPRSLLLKGYLSCYNYAGGYEKMYGKFNGTESKPVQDVFKAPLTKFPSPYDQLISIPKIQATLNSLFQSDNSNPTTPIVIPDGLESSFIQSENPILDPYIHGNVRFGTTFGVYYSALAQEYRGCKLKNGQQHEPLSKKGNLIDWSKYNLNSNSGIGSGSVKFTIGVIKVAKVKKNSDYKILINHSPGEELKVFDGSENYKTGIILPPSFTHEHLFSQKVSINVKSKISPYLLNYKSFIIRGNPSAKISLFEIITDEDTPTQTSDNKTLWEIERHTPSTDNTRTFNLEWYYESGQTYDIDQDVTVLSNIPTTLPNIPIIYIINQQLLAAEMENSDDYADEINKPCYPKKINEDYKNNFVSTNETLSELQDKTQIFKQITVETIKNELDGTTTTSSNNISILLDYHHQSAIYTIKELKPITFTKESDNALTLNYLDDKNNITKYKIAALNKTDPWRRYVLHEAFLIPTPTPTSTTTNNQTHGLPVYINYNNEIENEVEKVFTINTTFRETDEKEGIIIFNYHYETNTPYTNLEENKPTGVQTDVNIEPLMTGGLLIFHQYNILKNDDNSYKYLKPNTDNDQKRKQICILNKRIFGINITYADHIVNGNTSVLPDDTKTRVYSSEYILPMNQILTDDKSTAITNVIPYVYKLEYLYVSMFSRVFIKINDIWTCYEYLPNRSEYENGTADEYKVFYLNYETSESFVEVVIENIKEFAPVRKRKRGLAALASFGKLMKKILIIIAEIFIGATSSIFAFYITSRFFPPTTNFEKYSNIMFAIVDVISRSVENVTYRNKTITMPYEYPTNMLTGSGLIGREMGNILLRLQSPTIFFYSLLNTGIDFILQAFLPGLYKIKWLRLIVKFLLITYFMTLYIISLGGPGFGEMIIAGLLTALLLSAEAAGEDVNPLQDLGAILATVASPLIAFCIYMIYLTNPATMVDMGNMGIVFEKWLVGYNEPAAIKIIDEANFNINFKHEDLGNFERIYGKLDRYSGFSNAYFINANQEIKKYCINEYKIAFDVIDPPVFESDEDDEDVDDDDDDDVEKTRYEYIISHMKNPIIIKSIPPMYAAYDFSYSYDVILEAPEAPEGPEGPFTLEFYVTTDCPLYVCPPPTSTSTSTSTSIYFESFKHDLNELITELQTIDGFHNVGFPQPGSPQPLAIEYINSLRKDKNEYVINYMKNKNIIQLLDASILNINIINIINGKTTLYIEKLDVDKYTYLCKFLNKNKCLWFTIAVKDAKGNCLEMQKFTIFFSPSFSTYPKLLSNPKFRPDNGIDFRRTGPKPITQINYNEYNCEFYTTIGEEQDPHPDFYTDKEKTDAKKIPPKISMKHLHELHFFVTNEKHNTRIVKVTGEEGFLLKRDDYTLENKSHKIPLQLEL